MFRGMGGLVERHVLQCLEGWVANLKGMGCYVYRDGWLS
jgi:hypothetical protein